MKYYHAECERLVKMHALLTAGAAVVDMLNNWKFWLQSYQEHQAEVKLIILVTSCLTLQARLNLY